MSKIEWTDKTVNPIRARNKETGKVGHYCEKIATGCKGCYSERLQPYLGLFPFVKENREKLDIFLDDKALNSVLKRRTPTTYFWCSMTDLFLEHHPFGWVDRCFATMALTQQHLHIVLTKRGQRMYKWSEGTSQRWPLPNVVLGVSGSTQRDIDEQLFWLRRTPAVWRLLSLEPQIEDVNIAPYLTGTNALSWVIQGGGSGRDKRPFEPAWARHTRDQCAGAGVAYFLKQLGGDWARSLSTTLKARAEHDRKGGNPVEWPSDLRDCRAFPEVQSR